MTIIRPLTLSDKLKRRQASAQKNNAKEDDFETVFGDYIGMSFCFPSKQHTSPRSLHSGQDIGGGMLWPCETCDSSIQ